MRSALIHGSLLALALVAGWLVWTDEGADDSEAEGVLVWSSDPADVRSLTYTSDERTVRVERREEDGERYLWGIETLPSEPGPATEPLPDSAAVPEADSAAMEEPESTGPVTRSFPVGALGDELFERLGELRALRDLGFLDESRRADYGITDESPTVTIETGRGTHELRVGGTVFGGQERYAVDPTTGRGVVLRGDMVRRLQIGAGAIRERALHTYLARDVALATVRSTLGERVMAREPGDELDAVWSAPDAPGEADQTFANFMARLDQLSVSDYTPDLAPDDLDFLLRADYQDADGEALGYLELFRMPGSGEGPARYFVRTERTRVLGEVFSTLGERVEEDLAQVF